MGRLAPDRPSTLPGLSRRVAMFEGVAPRISVSTSTPSPLSSWRTSSWAWGRIASGSSWTVTPSCCTCSGRFPSTWLVPRMSASPTAPYATMSTPNMIPVSEVTAFRPSLTTAAGTINWERSLLAYGGFDSVEKHPGDIEAGLVGDFPEAGRAGDVDLGEPVPDHVQADEEQPLARELRPERVRDFQVSPRKGLCDAGAPGGEVAARFVEHLRAILLRELQKPGARDVLGVERRVLAHEHHFEFIERRLLWRCDPIPRNLVTGESEAGSFADNPTSLPHEAFLQHEIQIVAAR